MTEILNLALKKNIFEKIISGESNEIPIKKNEWWKKRLMNIDTGCFKTFQYASITSGSPDKTNYEIDHIEPRGDYYIVVIKNQPVNIEPEPTPEEHIQTPVKTVTTPAPEPVKTEFTFSQPEPEKPRQTTEQKITQKPTKKTESGTLSIKEAIWKVFEKFCQLKDVYVVNMPNVTIRNNGQIFGCSKRLIADRDSDVKFEFRKEEIIQNFGMSDEVFLGEIIAYLDGLLKNNYVFVNKNKCGFVTGNDFEIIFKMTVATKKKYLFNRY